MTPEEFAEKMRELEKDENCDLETCIKAEAERDALQQRLAALDWQQITPENLPKPGNEVWNRRLYVDFVSPEDVDVSYSVWSAGGWTHFRPIGAPHE